MRWLLNLSGMRIGLRGLKHGDVLSVLHALRVLLLEVLRVIDVTVQGLVQSL